MDDSQERTVIAVAVSFAVITFIIMVLRIYARACLVKHVGRDDYLISIAALLSWAFIAATIRAAQLGLGSHYPDVMERGIPNFVSYLQTVWLSSIFYNACLGFIKTSVLALYMRLGDPALRRLAMVMVVVVGCQATANVMACIFQCSPVEAAYDITIPDERKKCIEINAFYLANAAVNIFTDILTYALPIPLVLKLQVPQAQRIGLGVILCLGFVACLASVIRITFIPAMLVSTDPTWDISPPMYWSVIETNIGILASSIPSTKVIAKRYFPRLLGTSQGRSRTGPSAAGFRIMGSSAAVGGVSKGSVTGGGGSSVVEGKNFYSSDLSSKRGGDESDDLHELSTAKPMTPTPTGVRSSRKSSIHGLAGMRVTSDERLSDEEALTDVPQGRIGVTTQVSMQFDDQLPIQGRQ